MGTRASQTADRLSDLQHELVRQIRRQTAELERWREIGYEHWRQVLAYRGRGDTPPVWLHEALEGARSRMSRVSQRLSLLRHNAWEMSGTAFPEEEITQDCLHWNGEGAVVS